MVDGIEAAERGGIGEVWIGDEGPARDPFALLAAASVRTTAIRLGVGVTNPYLRHPAVIASTMATIHELSGGRSILGIGPGGHLSFGPVGLAPTDHLRACRRALTVMRGVLQGEAVEGYTPPSHAMTAPDLPIFVGSRGERFNRWASSEADGAFLAGIAPSMLDRTVAWATSARRIDLAIYISCVMSPTELDALRPRMIHAFSNGPDDLLALAGLPRPVAQTAADALAAGDPEPARSLLTDDRLDLVVARTPEQATAWLAALARRHGPLSVGLALMAEDPVVHVERAAAALAGLRSELDGGA
jgi:5,10-methylenetetrahydromethanopterin reductase